MDTLIFEGFMLDPTKSMKTNVLDNIAHYWEFQVDLNEYRHACKFDTGPEYPRQFALKVRFKDIDLINEMLSLRGRLRSSNVNM